MGLVFLDKIIQKLNWQTLFVIATIFNSYSNVYRIVDLNENKLQECLDIADFNDTVVLPTGVCTLTKQITISNKHLYIKGSGNCLTKIVNKIENGVCFLITTNESNSTRLSNINFIGPATTHGLININGNGKDFRIDHCVFDSITTGRAIVINANVNGKLYGVIDHCIFNEKNKIAMQGVSVFGASDLSWKLPLELGKESSVYIEDCSFIFNYPNDGALDAYRGARYVVRYCDIYNTFIGHHGFDSDIRSAFSYELYKNKFESSTESNIYTFFRSRGGTGVVFDNFGYGKYASGIQINYYRSCQCESGDLDSCHVGCSECHNLCSSYGRCNGSNPLDGNEDSTGWPCKDQIGRSTELPNGKQTYAPMYAWNNHLNDANVSIVVADPFGCSNPSMNDHLKENRDFFNEEHPTYRPLRFPHPLVTNDFSNLEQKPTRIRIVSY